MPTRTLQSTTVWAFFDHPDWIPFSPWQCALIERSFQDEPTLWVDVEQSAEGGGGGVVTIYFEDRDPSSMYLERYDIIAAEMITHSVRRQADDVGFEKEERRSVYVDAGEPVRRRERKFPNKLQQELQIKQHRAARAC